MSNSYPLPSVFFQDSGAIVSLILPREQNSKSKSKSSVRPTARSSQSPRAKPTRSASNYSIKRKISSGSRISSVYNELPSERAKYKRKYEMLKKHIKDLLLINVAYCDQIAETQDKILVAMGKRRYLTKKLLHHQVATETDNQLQVNDIGIRSSDQVVSSVVSTPAKKIVKKRSSGTFEALTVSGTKLQKDTHKNNSSMKAHKEVTKVKPLKDAKVTKDCAKLIVKPKKSRMMKSKPFFHDMPISIPKKLVQPVPTDIFGYPVIPIVLGDLVIDNLGDIIYDRPAYHTKDMIYPVGFCSTRIYGSIRLPGTRCIYTCRILDNGAYPKFEIQIDGKMLHSVAGDSPDNCHLSLLEELDHYLGVNLTDAPRGAEFFGLNHPVVLNVIQKLPGCKKCLKYRSTRFEVSAAAEDPYDNNDPGYNYKALQKLMETPFYGVRFDDDCY